MTIFYRLHSGGVVRNGAAVLLVGPNGAGKSTLVVRLATAGFSVLSDDEVWIDPESQLAHPTTRPFLLKEAAWDLFPKHRDKFVETGDPGCRSWWLRPEDLRAGCRATPTPVWGLVFLQADTGQRPALAEIGQTEALSHLLMESMNFPDVRHSGLSTLVSMVRSAKLFRLKRGDLDESAAMLSGVCP